MPTNNRSHVEEMNTRAAAVEGSTLDEENRTIRATISTDQPVAVYDWRSRSVIDEVLVARGGSFPDQVPLFDDHWKSSSAQLGSARSIKQEGSGWFATVHFARDAGAHRDEAWQMVKQRHVTDVSIGYRYGEKDFVDIAPGERKVVDGVEYQAGKRTTRVVTNWRGVEVSTTPIGADDQAKMRSAKPHTEPSLGCPDNSESLTERTNDSQRKAGDPMPKATTPETETETEQTRSADAGEQTPESPAPVAPVVHTTSDDAIEQARREAAQGERDRLAFINGFRSDIPDQLREQAIDEGWTIEKARGEFLQSFYDNNRPTGESEPQDVKPDHQASRNSSEGVRSARALTVALLLRSGISIESEGLISDVGQNMLRARGVNGSWLLASARSLASTGTLGESEEIFDLAYRQQSMPMRDLVRSALELEGVRCSSFDEGELMQRAMSSTNVSNMFTLAFNARVLEGFSSIADTTGSWTRPDTLPNFQSADRLQMGKYSRLQKRVRGGVPEHGTIDSKGESIRVFEYASKFVVDEQDLIDNTFGNIQQATPEEMGEAAAELAPDLAYSTLLSNPTMKQDSVALFNAAHENLNTTRALDYDNLIASRIAFATRTLPESGRHINIRPDVLLVSEELRPVADELVSAKEKLAGTTGYNANTGKHQVVSDPRLDVGVTNPETGDFIAGEPTSWFLAAARGRYGMSLAYLDGRGRSPRTRRLMNVNDGYAMGWSIDHVVGCAPTGFEGIQKNEA